MSKTLGFLFALLLVAALAGPALAGPGDCGGLQSVDTGTLITADGSTASGPVTPVPPKTEPEG